MDNDKSYKKIEVVGTSTNSVSEAVDNAIHEAEESVDNLEWFEVGEIRGAVKDNELVYQVSVSIGFRLK